MIQYLSEPLQNAIRIPSEPLLYLFRTPSSGLLLNCIDKRNTCYVATLCGNTSFFFCCCCRHVFLLSLFRGVFQQHLPRLHATAREGCQKACPPALCVCVGVPYWAPGLKLRPTLWVEYPIAIPGPDQTGPDRSSSCQLCTSAPLTRASLARWGSYLVGW